MEAALPALTGEIIQRPSVYSAIKVGGRPLYDRARRGEDVEAPERTVHVERIEYLGDAPDHGVCLRVTCGRGTYIRSICHDLGRLCGCPAHMRSLTRTKSGFFRLEGALTLEQARELAGMGELEKQVISMDAPLQHLPRMDASLQLTRKVDAGAKLPLAGMEGLPPGEAGSTRVYLQGRFRGMAVRQGDELVWRMQIPAEDA